MSKQLHGIFFFIIFDSMNNNYELLTFILIEIYTIFTLMI